LFFPFPYTKYFPILYHSVYHTKPEWRSRCGDWTADGANKEYFQFRYVTEVLILSEASRPDLSSIQPPIKWALLLTAEFAVDLVNVLPWGKPIVPSL
jgi:hypothetical protein